MIKKLKLRYLITNMSLLCGTLLIFLGVLFAFLYHSEINASYRVMEKMLEQADMPQRQMDVPSPTVEQFGNGSFIQLDSEIQEDPAQTAPGFDPNQINPWENQWGTDWSNAQWNYNPWIYNPWIYNPWAYQWYINNDPNNPYNNGGQDNGWGQYPYNGTYPDWGIYQQPQNPDQQPIPPDQENHNNSGAQPESPAEPQPNPQYQQQPDLPDNHYDNQQQTPLEPDQDPAQTVPPREKEWSNYGIIGSGRHDYSIQHFVTTAQSDKKGAQTHTEPVQSDAETDTETPNDTAQEKPVQNPAQNPLTDYAVPPASNDNAAASDDPAANLDSSFRNYIEPRSVIPIQEGQYVPNILIVQTDENGNVASYAGAGLNNPSESSDENLSMVNQAWDKIQKNGSEQGVVNVNDSYFRFMKRDDMIILLDRTPELSIISKLIMIFVLIALLGIIVMFMVSWKLANWSVSPIALAWEKQKQFVADASHELKTPLAVISANTEVLLSNPGASVSGQSKWLNYIQSETMRMSKLISSLLSIARMDHPEQAADESTVISMSETVSNICLQFEPIIYENGKTLNTVIQRKVTFKADEDNVKQLLSILLDNAVLHSVPKAQITVSLSKDTQGKIRLAVANTAKDIPKEQLEHLFDRFYRVDTEGSPNGSGLGLSIAKSIVHQMGGKISVTSENQLVTFTAVF